MIILDSNAQRKTDEFYASLKEKLDETHDFPENYLFKFILPNNTSKFSEIYRIFDGIKTTFTNRESKNAKYTSLSVNAFVIDADQVIKIYKEVSLVKEVIVL
ncbi:MAG: DUF493 domain-containing protein [Bergeyella sp.]|nr:DUF493 domain-containing protein [Bergeyella sp.]